MHEVTLRVLIVEDDEGDYLLTCEALRRGGGHCDITWVDRIERAVAAMEAKSFDVILLDLHLPDSTGWASLEPVFRRPAGTALIVFTGVEDERIGVEAVNRGAQDYVFKGILSRGPSDLVHAIDKAVRHARREHGDQSDTSGAPRR